MTSTALTARERLQQTLDFTPGAQPFLPEGWAWTETCAVWRTQGWDGRSLADNFGTDRYADVAPHYGPAPDFAYTLIEEDATTRVYINPEGILMREFIEHADTSMPQFLKFPVEDEADFDKLYAERLQLSTELRLNEVWHTAIAGQADTPYPRRCWPGRWGGFFGAPRNLMGLENLCIAYYEQPALIEKMMVAQAYMLITVTEQVLQHTPIDVFWFWEDMAYNHGSLIDPKVFRKFAMPHYRRVVEWLHSKGIRHIGLDSDGDISELIPLWLDAGINFLWPFEVEAGMDVLAVRREYGHALAIGGGIPKLPIAQGGAAMRAAVDRVMPLLEDGGYLPELDHGAPPDIAWPQMCEYMEYLVERVRRG